METPPSFSEEDREFSIDSSYHLDTDSDPDQVQPILGESFTYLGQLILIEKELIKLASNKLNPIYESTYGHLLHLRSEKWNIQNHFALNDFSPYLNLFFSMIETAKEKKYSNLEFLEALRTAMTQGDSFKKEVQKRRKAISKNKQSLLRYIESLFEYRSRLLVLRIDFSYKKDVGGFFTTSEGERISFTNGIKNKALLEKWSIEVREQRNQLLKNLKKKYKNDLVGYVWKLEYGADKAFHYHMIFFLDESNHRQDIKIAESIGEMWKQQITQEKGIYWNCNATKKHYEKNNRVATGKIKHDDHELRENLNIMASYLTKPDYFIKLTLPDGARTFGKGAKPKKIKSGRPRN